MNVRSSPEKAVLGPFVLFVLLLGLDYLIADFFDGADFWALREPSYWTQPLQSVLCGLALAAFWPAYHFTFPRKIGWALGIGFLAWAIWIGPQILFHGPPRIKGFDPTFFGPQGWPYFLTLSLRFFRLVVIVPLVEEIFWRGFLLRFFVNENFTEVPFGTFTWRSFLFVMFGFMLEHSPADWPAALATGALYNLVAYRTRSLSACVLAHAITNLLLGFYILQTRQWGFW